MSDMGCQRCYDSPCTCTFIESAVAGAYDDLHDGFEDAVEKWHTSGGNEHLELYNFLGMTRDEYRRVVESPSALEQVVSERRALVQPAPGLVVTKVAPRVLPPCARPGMRPGDWWTTQHVSCTGSQHLYDPVLGTVEIPCACTECHGNKKPEEALR